MLMECSVFGGTCCTKRCVKEVRQLLTALCPCLEDPEACGDPPIVTGLVYPPKLGRDGQIPGPQDLPSLRTFLLALQGEESGGEGWYCCSHQTLRTRGVMSRKLMPSCRDRSALTKPRQIPHCSRDLPGAQG